MPAAGRIRTYAHRHALALAAIFIALGGTAWAGDLIGQGGEAEGDERATEAAQERDGSEAQAQSGDAGTLQGPNFQSFVSTSGNDANSCTRAAACRTLQRAVDQTQAGGNVFVLNSGDFDAVAISHSISIVAASVDATLFTGATTKVTIDAAPQDVVYLEGLHLYRQQISGENSGIEINTVGRVHVRDCVIRGLSTGILMRNSSASKLFVSGCTLTNNGSGVVVNPGGTAPATAFLDDVVVERHDRAAIQARGRRARIRLSGVAVTDNKRGLTRPNGGKLLSFGNNAIAGNRTDGAPSRTIRLK